MNQAFHLYRLQQIDTQIDHNEASLGEINRLLSADEAVRQANQAVEEAGLALHKARQQLKQNEFAVSEQQTKIATCEANLYSGKLRNPKEMQDLQKEIVSLKKYLATLEDHQLESMLEVEAGESQESAAQAALAQAQATFAESAAGWLAQKDQLTRTIERLQAERSAGLSLVTPESLQQYNNLRKRKSGVAVAIANDGSCSVCGASLRPAEIQAVRASPDISHCTSCGRILYAG